MCNGLQDRCSVPRPQSEKPVVNGPRLRFVRFSGNALTQGLVNTRIDGVPVRIYSVAKTITDCLKYRLARALRFKRCEKVSLKENVAAKDSRISRRCAV